MKKPTICFKGKRVVGLIEEIDVIGPKKKKKVIAKIDTGATKSSVDTRLAAELGLGPVTQTKMVRSAYGSRLRPIVEAKIRLAGKILKTKLTIADRSHMKYQMLVGQNALDNGFLIDPSKKEKT